jgi:hypothetical protein
VERWDADMSTGARIVFCMLGILSGIVATLIIFQSAVTVGDLLPIPMLVISGLLIAWSDED